MPSNNIHQRTPDHIPDTDTANTTSTFSLYKLFITWFIVGATSFGGGAITQFLIQEHFIYKRKWLQPSEYVHFLGMCQLTPGMNIIGLTILIGQHLGKRKGVIISMLGLILPSAAITVGLTAVYTTLSSYPHMQSMLRALFAAILGISFATNWRNLKPILIDGYKRGWAILYGTL